MKKKSTPHFIFVNSISVKIFLIIMGIALTVTIIAGFLVFNFSKSSLEKVMSENQFKMAWEAMDTKNNIKEYSKSLATKKILMGEFGSTVLSDIEEPTSITFASAHNIAMRTTTIFAIIIFFMAIITLLLVSKFISIPLLSLTNTVKNILKDGDLSKPITIHSNDEIGLLASTFNALTSQLKKSYDHLESKVKEKTYQLHLEAKKSETHKKYLEGLLDNLPVGVFIIESKKGIPLMLNKAGIKILEHGLDPKVKIGNYSEIYNVFKEDGSPYPNDELPLSIATTTKKCATKDNIFIKRPDGNRIQITSTACPIFNKNGKIIAAISVFSDITKEKQIDREKTEFVSLASHQLRTPLSTMNWYIEMLMDGDEGVINKEQKKSLLEVYRSSQHMGKLVNALLNISRIELGTLFVNTETVNIPKIADNILHEITQDIIKKKLTIKKIYSQSLKPSKTDSKLLRIIFQNLLTNAVKYTPKKGTISLEISKKQNNILIKITDTGYGIPKQEQSKIFTKLFRATNIQTLEANGTGLGLYIVKAIVEKLGGTIWFISEENKGSTFFVSLPIQNPKKKKLILS